MKDSLAAFAKAPLPKVPGRVNFIVAAGYGARARLHKSAAVGRSVPRSLPADCLPATQPSSHSQRVGLAAASHGYK